MPLDTLITGRIATLAGESGFGWVEAIGIRDGRIAFAGSAVDLETRADPHTQRITLEPDEVAVPGLTDSHLHLAQAAAATRQVDLSDAATLAEGLVRIHAAHVSLTDPDAWLEGHGWDSDRWGRWPTAADLEHVAPGRRCAIWAHDHHALLVSRAALRTAVFRHGDAFFRGTFLHLGTVGRRDLLPLFRCFRGAHFVMHGAALFRSGQ